MSEANSVVQEQRSAPMNAFTIQLGVPALERLLGDVGGDVFVKIRQSALEEFTRRRVRALVPEEATKMVMSLINKEISEQVGTIARTWRQGEYKEDAVLRPAMQAAIEGRAKIAVMLQKKAIEEELDTAVNAAVAKFLSVVNLEKQIEELAKYYVAKQIKDKLNEVVKQISPSVS